jgi:hypothetical protein
MFWNEPVTKTKKISVDKVGSRAINETGVSKPSTLLSRDLFLTLALGVAVYCDGDIRGIIYLMG